VNSWCARYHAALHFGVHEFAAALEVFARPATQSGGKPPHSGDGALSPQFSRNVAQLRIS